jgi:hypothetical protein
VHLKGKDYYLDYEQQAKHLEELTSYLKNEKVFNQPRDTPSVCHTHKRNATTDPDAEFVFLPAYVGQITPKNSKLEFEGNCFEKVEIDMQYTEGSNQVEITVKTHNPRNLTCSDFFMFGNTEIIHVEEFWYRGTHKLTFKLPTQDAEVDLSNFGLEAYLFCEPLKDEILSIFTSLKAFIGGLGLHGKVPLFQPHVPEYMEKANLEFLKWSQNIEFEERPIQKVEIDENEI